MRKLRLLLALFVASFGAMQSASARTAPELPEAQTPVSGTSYYLYNVLEGKFLCQSTTDLDYAALGTYGEKVIITATQTAGEYTIQWASNNYYWFGYDTYIESRYYKDSDLSMFTIAKSSNGYTIQRSASNIYYYVSDEFVGYDGSNGDRLTPALTEGSIHWVFYSLNDAEYYMAKHKLYTYLELADQYNFYVTQYNAVYENPGSTTEELNLAQETLANALEMSQNYVSPNWTEYPILFQNTTENKWKLDDDELYWYIYKQWGSALEATSTLTATVNVDNNATLAFTYHTDNEYSNLRVFLDGELVQIVTNNVSYGNARRYYVELTPGKHDIAWTCLYNNANSDSGGSQDCQHLSEIGVQDTPTIIPATTTVEGQLGTEVLKLVDPVSSVKKIVIKGIIGADDWTTIGLMVNAFSIDMSGATATSAMPEEIFKGSKFKFLHDVKLPQGLTAIGERAFYESDVENNMTYPATLVSIGDYAFHKSKLTGANMQEGITSIGNYAFENCYYLENVTYPATAGLVPYSCFRDCYNLRSFTIPEGIKTIDQYAFRNCSHFNARFPSTMETVGYGSFYNTATDSLIIDENMTVMSYAFNDCKNLVYAEWPTSFDRAIRPWSDDGTNMVVANCPKLNKVKLKSPTVVTYDYQNFFNGNTLSNITLQVPDFLESTYKLDPYWYQCNVEGFNSAEIEDWNIKQALVLNPGQRISGSPNLHFSGGNSSFTVNGDDTQTIGDLSIYYSPIQFYADNSEVGRQWGMMLGNTNNVNITGELTENVCTKEKTWYFLTLPFDTKVGDIVATAYETSTATSYAIRYYDGATRASGSTGSNWKNYAPNDIIPAGTGFIYQTARDAYSKFVAQNNESKQYILSNNEFTKALSSYPSDAAADKGWNLVGNPWQTYYNIHKLNFTAPITVWNLSKYNSSTGSYGTYEAYSIIDDDYAIKPLEAIFVQCPDEINSISFPIDGRQLTDVIESQNAARTNQPGDRKLIDVVLSDGDMTDRTRFVLNPQASLDYEVNCDASKFFSMSSVAPQLWTVEQGTSMAINERPIGNGTVQLGFKVAESGMYTISTPRNQFKNIVLVDNATNTETDLSDQAAYTFYASAGTNDTRFALRIGSAIVNGIQSAQTSDEQAEQVFDLQGRRVNQPQKGLYIVNGKKVVK